MIEFLSTQEGMVCAFFAVAALGLVAVATAAWVIDSTKRDGEWIDIDKDWEWWA